MASGKRARRAPQKQAAIAGPVMLLSDWQRRAVLMLLVSGLLFTAIGVFLTPNGGGYWAAVFAAPVLGGVLGFLLGGGPGRTLDARLMRSTTPQGPVTFPKPAALPASEQAALQTALLPLLLAELSGAAGRMAPREKAAAFALVEAGATAPDTEARQVLGRDLPRLIGALAAGGDAAAGETEALARRLAQPAGGRR